MTSNLTSGNLKGRMKTTIQLDDQLLLEAKQYTVQTGRTLKAVIEDALREALARTEATRPQTRVPWEVHGARAAGIAPRPRHPSGRARGELESTCECAACKHLLIGCGALVREILSVLIAPAPCQ